MNATPLPDAVTDAADAVDDGKTMSALSVPTSFGVFKPVGHVMLGLPTQAAADALVLALHRAGWPGTALQHFAPQDSIAELQAMVDNAGPLAGFGYEIRLLERYLALAREGHRFLLVHVDDDAHAATVAALARDNGAALAVHYHRLTVEELL